MNPSDAVTRIEATSLRPNLGAVPGTISLAMGEPDFETPAEIVEAAVAALRAGRTRYADPLGDPELRDVIAAAVGAVASRPFARDEIVVTHGASAGLAAAIVGSVNPGDRVVIPEPTYSLYVDLVQLAGAVPVFVPLRDDYHLDFECLAEALDGARLLVLCSPGNPTGAVYRADEWARIARLLRASATLVVSDEAYHAIVYDAPFTSALMTPELRDRLIYAQTFSKAAAMTGWRLGYLAGPREIVRAAGRIHRTFNGPINAFVQRAALVALDAGAAHAAQWLDAYRERRDLTCARLNAIDGITVEPSAGGFYAFARYTAPVASTDLVARFAEAGVAVRAGREYGPGGEGHFRVSFATSPDTLRAGIDRIALAYTKISRR